MGHSAVHEVDRAAGLADVSCPECGLTVEAAEAAASRRVRNLLRARLWLLVMSVAVVVAIAGFKSDSVAVTHWGMRDTVVIPGPVTPSELEAIFARGDRPDWSGVLRDRYGWMPEWRRGLCEIQAGFVPRSGVRTEWVRTGWPIAWRTRVTKTQFGDALAGEEIIPMQWTGAPGLTPKTDRRVQKWDSWKTAGVDVLVLGVGLWLLLAVMVWIGRRCGLGLWVAHRRWLIVLAMILILGGGSVAALFVPVKRHTSYDFARPTDHFQTRMGGAGPPVDLGFSLLELGSLAERIAEGLPMRDTSGEQPDDVLMLQVVEPQLVGTNIDVEWPARIVALEWQEWPVTSTERAGGGSTGWRARWYAMGGMVGLERSWAGPRGFQSQSLWLYLGGVAKCMGVGLMFWWVSGGLTRVLVKRRAEKRRAARRCVGCGYSLEGLRVER